MDSIINPYHLVSVDEQDSATSSYFTGRCAGDKTSAVPDVSISFRDRPRRPREELDVDVEASMSKMQSDVLAVGR